MATPPEFDELARHEDIAVRVWNEHLEGYSAREIWRYGDISLERVKRILVEAPPALIAADLRHRTGQMAFWISQGERDRLTTTAGEDAAFLVIFRPRRIPQHLVNKGLRAIRRKIRARGRPGFDFGGVAEAEPMSTLLRMVHNRGYPAWEIDAQGEAKSYDGRHGALIPEETASSPGQGV